VQTGLGSFLIYDIIKRSFLFTTSATKCFWL